MNTLSFSAARRTQFDRMCRIAEAIAGEAFDRWIRTLRWKSLKGDIGQKQIVGIESGWGVYLQDATTGKRFYTPPHIISVGRSTPIPTRAWKRIGDCLLNDVDPPIWFDFLFEGQHRVLSDDLHGGVTCLAIACEAVIRVLMGSHLRRPVNESFSALTSNTPIGRILDGWQNLGFWSPAWRTATDLPSLKRLFKLRNDVMHRGHVGFDQTECAEVVKAARSFIIHASPFAERLRTA